MDANKANNVNLQHLVRPGRELGSNPYKYIVVRLDGDNLALEVVGVDWGEGFRPYQSNKIELEDSFAR